MRRLALSVIASCGLAILSACAAGSGFSGTVGSNATVPDSIVFQNGSAQVDNYLVAPNGNAPILVSAVGVKGAGIGSTYIPDLAFQWSAVYAPAGTTYTTGVSPNGNNVCGAPPAGSPPINSLLQFGPGGAAYPGYTGLYTQLSAQPGSNPPNYTQQTAQVFVAPPTVGGVQVVPPAGGSYCMLLTALHGPSGRSGFVIIVVRN